jgi:Type I phosphodiesterase / nucleotide pyrophosphatase
VLLAVLASAGVWAGADRGGPPERSASTGVRPLDARLYLEAACGIPTDWARYVYRGWDPGPQRAWDLAVVPRAENWFGSFTGTSHSGPYAYLQRVPLVLYGPEFIARRGDVRLDREVTIADLAPTYAQLMGFELPDAAAPGLPELLDDAGPPAVIVTLVIDGGGWNVLNAWPNAWPHLRDLMEEGASVQDAVVGSSPSITPAIHTNLSTGQFPRTHGVMAIVARSDEGKIVSGFADQPYLATPDRADPTVTLDTPTLADLWDLAAGNEAQIAMIASQNFHLGMIGHGAALEGGDSDIAAMTDLERVEWATNPEFYTLPRYASAVEGPEEDLRSIDIADGRADGQWRGHEYWRIDATPAYASWENRLLEELMLNEGFGSDDVTDLVYLNYKAPDAAGHRWNMTSAEQSDVLESVDRAIAQVIDFLERAVGSGRFVVAVTADHGQTPLGGRGWPIAQGEVNIDLQRRFDHIDNNVRILQRTSSALYFTNRREMKRNGVTPEDIASYLTQYSIGENLPQGENAPSAFRARLDEQVFAAVIPGRRIDDMARCHGITSDG